MSVQYWHYF